MRNIMKWEDCGRDDLNMIPTMIKNGFTVEFTHEDIRWGRTVEGNFPHGNVTFSKGNQHVWKAYQSNNGLKSYWITAELVGDRYVNHKEMDNLSDLFVK